MLWIFLWPLGQRLQMQLPLSWWLGLWWLGRRLGLRPRSALLVNRAYTQRLADSGGPYMSVVLSPL